MDTQQPKHYICTGGCAGVSKDPGICQTDSCPKHGLPLEECSCTDNTHKSKDETGEDAV